MEAARVRIAELTPALRDDYLAFFDHDAFVDNPRWASCYCFYNHAPHDREKWESRGAQENRAAIANLIDRGELRGYLAYLGAKPIAWCNANVHARYTTLDDQPNRARVGAIMCFIVAKPFRNQGVASGLLDAACAGFQMQGLDAVEGLAARDSRDEARNHHGPLAMYLRAGFKPVREAGEIVVVRKSLRSVERADGDDAGR